MAVRQVQGGPAPREVSRMLEARQDRLESDAAALAALDSQLAGAQALLDSRADELVGAARMG